MIVKTDKESFADFLSDAANFKGDADAVYFPESEQDFATLLKECSSKNIPVTIAGNGTGVTGARVPNGGVVAATSRLNKILEINRGGKYALVQCGVLLKDLQDEVESAGLFYPPDPTERNCFIGGTIATNASGARTFKYGPTRDYILGLKIVLADGDILTLERNQFAAVDYILEIVTDSGKNITLDIPRYKMPAVKHAAGYFTKENIDAVDLFIGSEGTLGVVVEAKLKLLDLPKNIFSCVQFFESESEALLFVDEARDCSHNNNNIINARGLEFFDSFSLKFMKEEYPAIPNGMNAAIWFEQEFGPDNENEIVDAWTDLIDRHKGKIENAWLALNKLDYEKFKDFRHSISARVNEYCTAHGVTKVGTDTAVPVNKFHQFYDYCRSTTIEAGLKFVAYGHAGNCHIHLNMLPENREQYVTAKEVYGKICREAVRLGGTISAEHGIGKFKTDYLLEMYGEANILEMAKLKKQLDPHLILSPGNIFNTSFLKDVK